MTVRGSTLSGVFLVLFFFLSFPGNAQIADHANLVWTGPATCLPCHETQARALHGAAHYQWQGPAPYMTGGPPLQGKISSSLNSYCINILGNWVTCSNCHVGLGQPPLPDATPAQLQNIDCLVCHQAGYKRVKIGGVFVPDLQNMTLTMDEAARTVHSPVRLNCIQCHGKGGGGDNYKRGDIAVAHGNTTDRNFDVHMATTGGNLACQACHTVSNHHIAGRGADLRSTDLDVAVTCSSSQCHPNKTSAAGHQTAEVNRHVARVACQTCHIPVYAKNAADTAATEATEVHRTWLEPHQIPTGAFHPLSVLANDVKPVYRFWNKYNTNYNLYDPAYLDPGTGRYPTSRPVGRINDRTTASKLYPFKYKTAVQPLASSRGQLIALDTGVYFASGNVPAAVQAGLVNMGYTAADPYEFTETDTFQLITHEVSPAAQVLNCSSCHGTKNQMDLNGLGYVLKSVRNNVCAQCHSLEKANEPLAFGQLHNLHVIEKKYDCNWCHSFSRPERQLTLPSTPAKEADYDGNRATDVAAVHLPSNQFLTREGGNLGQYGWGDFESMPLVWDYDGNGATNVSIYHIPTNQWLARGYAGDNMGQFGWGLDESVPVPGDYDGDGVPKRAFYHWPSNRWFVEGWPAPISFGWNGAECLPVPGDYDGDGKTDLVLYHLPSNQWFMYGAGNLGQFGWDGPECLPVPGDYDGDGAVEIAVYHVPSNQWFVKGYPGSNLGQFGWGGAESFPIPGDYDGDGITDRAFYRWDSNRWFIEGQGDFVWGWDGANLMPVPGQTAVLNWYRFRLGMFQ
jgi:hypothetical protein